MIIVTLDEFNKYIPNENVNQMDLDVASSIIYSYINFAEPTEQATIDIVKKAIMMLCKYDLENGILSGVAKNEVNSVSIEGFSYSTGSSKIKDISKVNMPYNITALLAPTGLLFRGMC